MAQVTVSLVIRAPLGRVYERAKQVEDFPRFMPDLERVTVLERRDGLPAVTEWVGIVEGRRIRWVEEDSWTTPATSAASASGRATSTATRAPGPSPRTARGRGPPSPWSSSSAFPSSAPS